MSKFEDITNKNKIYSTIRTGHELLGKPVEPSGSAAHKVSSDMRKYIRMIGIPLWPICTLWPFR